MARIEDIPQPTRDAALAIPCPSFDTEPFVAGPPLARRRVAIVSSAALIRRGDKPFPFGSAECRFVPASTPTDEPPEAWPGFAARFLAGELPGVVGHDTPALALRFLCDDVKAFYGEAAQAVGAAPSSRQVDTWFWRETVAGQLLIALRDMALTSENNALKTVGGRFFVPVPWLRARATPAAG